MIRLGDVGALAAPTPLSERLWPVESAHPDATRAFVAGRDLLLGGQPIEMRALAATLGVEWTSLLRRIAKAFTYADLITGETPDATQARLAFAVVLGEPEPLDSIADPPQPLPARRG